LDPTYFLNLVAVTLVLGAAAAGQSCASVSVVRFVPDLASAAVVVAVVVPVVVVVVPVVVVVVPVVVVVVPVVVVVVPVVVVVVVVVVVPVKHYSWHSLQPSH